MTDELTPEQQLDAAYRERAHLVAWLAAKYPAVIAPAPDVDEPGWQIVYLTAGGWQLSWHISPRDADLFDHVERVPVDDARAQWDGHTTDEKYARIRELAGAGAAVGGQLAELRSWLAAEALKIQHRLPAMRVPEVWRSMDGMAHGLDYTVRVIDSYMATGKLPVTGGAECDCADPETDHSKLAAGRPSTYPLEPSDSCLGPGALPYRCYCDCQGCERGDCAAHQTLRQRTDRAEAAVAALRKLAADMRTWCSPHGVAVDYADRIDEALAAPTPEAGRG